MRIHSDLTNWIVKTASSNSSKLIRILVGFIIAIVAKKKLIPDEALPPLQQGLEQLGASLATTAFVWFEIWLNERKQAGAKVLQQAINTQLPAGYKIEEDGIIGNKTITAFPEATGITFPVKKIGTL